MSDESARALGPPPAAEVVVPVPMTLDKARRFEWAGHGSKRPMGELLDQGLINERDLGWAITADRPAPFKQAAYTLLAYRLSQRQVLHQVLRHGPDLVRGSRYLEDREFEGTVSAFMFLGVGVVGVSVFAVMMLDQLWQALQAQRGPWLATLIAWGTLGLALLVLASPLIWWIRREWRQGRQRARDFRAGREGEQWVLERIRARLDNRWTVFSNLPAPEPASGHDLDLVLVGPPGVWVLEVKAYRAPVRCVDGTWEMHKCQRWVVLPANPSKQAAGNARELKYYLEKYNILVSWVNRAVILAAPQQVSHFPPPADPKAVPVWLHFQVDAELAALNEQAETLPPDTRARIASQFHTVAHRRPRRSLAAWFLGPARDASPDSVSS